MTKHVETLYATVDREELRQLQKDAERYRALRKVTPYRFKKIQDACITDGGDVFYFHSDRFDSAIDALLAAQGERHE